MKAIVNIPICPLKSSPEAASIEDEVLFGMEVDITGPEQNGWLPVRTHYRYEGMVPADALVTDPALVEAWQGASKRIVLHKNFADVLGEPKVQGAFLASALPRGAHVVVTGEAENGWQPVLLPDGRAGFTCASFLDTLWETPCQTEEKALRRALTDAARLYAGSQYRWGGKSPAGLDCSGLCSMAYMLCGITIYRDANIVEGFPIHEIPLPEMREGDLIFFPGHVAMYLGDGLYIHSTGKAGDNGVTINSFDARHPLFREDLPKCITAVGSYF